MALKLMSVDDLMLIAGSGGGFRRSGALLSVDDLMKIATRAQQGGARVTFTGMKLKSVDDLKRIAVCGGGQVAFEDDD